MENIIIELKPGVTPMEQSGVPGLSLAGRIRLAKNAQQAALIHALAAREQPLEELHTILHERNGPTPDENAEALELAAFILDFEEYIESKIQLY